jgi:antitoxin VapB
MNEQTPARKRVHVFRNGRSRAIRIPKEFEFEGDEVDLTRQPDGSITVSVVRRSSLADYLKTAEPWTGEDFIIDDRDLPSLDEVRF